MEALVFLLLVVIAVCFVLPLVAIAKATAARRSVENFETRLRSLEAKLQMLRRTQAESAAEQPFAAKTEAAEREGVRYEIEHYWRVPRTPFEPGVVSAVEAAARSLGVGHRRMLSGAGHDAQYMAAICPTGMVFVPSRAGRSHCEEEFTPMDDIEHGANVLFLTCAGLAGHSA